MLNSFFFINFLKDENRKYINKEKSKAAGIDKLSIGIKWLLNAAEIYWLIEIWPNLKCRFESPKIILFSFSMLM